jgi:hypothetical protein
LANRSHGDRSYDSDQVDIARYHFGGEFGQQMQLPFGCSKIKADAFTFNPAKVPQSRLEGDAAGDTYYGPPAMSALAPLLAEYRT